MQSVLLAIHFILTISIIGLIMLQKHDSDGALGSSGGGAGSGMFSVRGQANLLTRTTAVLMSLFIVNCLILAKMFKHQQPTGSLIDRVASETMAVPPPVGAPLPKTSGGTTGQGAKTVPAAVVPPVQPQNGSGIADGASKAAPSANPKNAVGKIEAPRKKSGPKA
ncbi:MAG: preprotein translocase subunit SecG [Holosporaceae bacterium]|jgi:preprotein translocase subunit SecG|nr:preprotein translocase subunit SecG [Holosporaceae bacterium]